MLKPHASFVDWTVTNHMKSNFCKMDSNPSRHCFKRYLNRCVSMWLMGFDCPLHHPMWCEQKGQVWSCSMMEHTEAVETRGLWTEEEPHWLIIVCGDLFIQSKTQGQNCNSQWHDVKRYTGQTLRLGSFCYSILSDRSAMWPSLNRTDVYTDLHMWILEWNCVFLFQTSSRLHIKNTGHALHSRRKDLIRKMWCLLIREVRVVKARLFEEKILQQWTRDWKQTADGGGENGQWQGI